MLADKIIGRKFGALEINKTRRLHIENGVKKME